MYWENAKIIFGSEKNTTVQVAHKVPTTEVIKKNTNKRVLI